MSLHAPLGRRYFDFCLGSIYYHPIDELFMYFPSCIAFQMWTFSWPMHRFSIIVTIARTSLIFSSLIFLEGFVTLSILSSLIFFEGVTRLSILIPSLKIVEMANSKQNGFTFFCFAKLEFTQVYSSWKRLLKSLLKIKS